MIIEHKLIITERVKLDSIFPLVKILKKYICNGLKVVKFIIDLLPGNRDLYFDRIGDSGDSPEIHIEYIHNNSDVRINDITDDSITITFNMDICLTYEFKKELQNSTIGKSIILKGLEELRNDKIDSLLL